MYLFYIDESGEREYTSRGRYFVLTTLGVRASEWKSLNNDVLMLKQTYFKDTRVELKSTWLRIPHHRKNHYLDPYGLADSELTELTEKLYGALLSYDVVLIAAVVDKNQVQATYSSPQSPSSLAYRLLFERVEMFLEHRAEECYGIMIFDKITELQIMKRGYEDLLSKQHSRYLEKGTEYVNINRIVEGLLFITSSENNLLQLADLCCYNIYRQFHDHGTEWDKSGGLFIKKYPYFERIEPKLHRSPGGAYAGWGIKKFPAKAGKP